jgi:hypothetical protein
MLQLQALPGERRRRRRRRRKMLLACFILS